MVLPLNPMGAFSSIRSVPVGGDFAIAASIPPVAAVRQHGANTSGPGVSEPGPNVSSGGVSGWGGFQAALAAASRAETASPVDLGGPLSGWVPPNSTVEALANQIIGYSALSRAAPEAAPAGQIISTLA